MKKIGIFFGSDTGNTEKVAKKIRFYLGKNNSDIFDISKTKKKNIKKYKILLLGISTWYYGEPQCDWMNFFPILKKIDLSEKCIAIFGCGDQKSYPNYFCDAMFDLFRIVQKSSPKIIGLYPNKNYQFISSKALIKKNTFLGLVIDEDSQPDLTDIRIKKWVKNITFELKNL